MWSRHLSKVGTTFSAEGAAGSGFEVLSIYSVAPAATTGLG